jgi:hypothetical protein
MAVGRPVPIQRPDVFIIPFKKRTIFAQEDLPEMDLPNISPFRFLVKGHQEMFEGYKSRPVRDEAKFIRPSP